jgi:antitoxin CptB
MAPAPERLYIRRSFMTTDKDARLKKLKLRAWRRGFREADLILGPFADRHVPIFSEAELDAFEHILDQPDQHLYDWILGRDEPPAHVDPAIMRQIRIFRDELHKLEGSGRGG